MFKDPEICRIMFDKSDVHTFSRLEVAMLVATFFRRVAKSGNPWKKKNTKSKVGGFVRSQMIYICRSQNATKMTTSRKHPKIFHYKTLLKSNFCPKKAIPKIPPPPSPARKIFGTAADGTLKGW